MYSRICPISATISASGNDHYILDSIVFSSKIGLEVNGAANVIKGVHVWFPENQALAFVSDGRSCSDVADSRVLQLC
jgi:hypothetical protein